MTISFTIIASSIGMITGIVGAITGIWSAKKANDLKSLDLRLESGQINNNIKVKLDSIDDLLKQADRSRTFRLAAQGNAKSGVMEKWQTDKENHATSIKEFKNNFLKLEAQPSNSKTKELENKILKLGLLKERVDAVIAQLKQSIQEDDIARDKLHQDRMLRNSNALSSCIVRN
jgi:hydroxymethylpyrimidine pyrophosphatase-like HAD family hydrolase